MRKYIIFFGIFLLIIFFVFGIKNVFFGNNNTSQDDVKNIFKMSEYEAEIEVTVISNKNENKYKIKQQYIKNEDKSIQEIIEPNNLNGIKITKQGNNIRLENTQLNLSKIFENYNGLAQNDMDLQCFIKEFEENEKSIKKEENEQIILETEAKNNNKYLKNKVLYIDKKTGNPTKMEITDINKKTIVYIVYNKVDIK